MYVSELCNTLYLKVLQLVVQAALLIAVACRLKVESKRSLFLVPCYPLRKVKAVTPFETLNCVTVSSNTWSNEILSTQYILFVMSRFD